MKIEGAQKAEAIALANINNASAQEAPKTLHLTALLYGYIHERDGPQTDIFHLHAAITTRNSPSSSPQIGKIQPNPASAQTDMHTPQTTR